MAAIIQGLSFCSPFIIKQEEEKTSEPQLVSAYRSRLPKAKKCENLTIVPSSHIFTSVSIDSSATTTVSKIIVDQDLLALPPKSQSALPKTRTFRTTRKFRPRFFKSPANIDRNRSFSYHKISINVPTAELISLAKPVKGKLQQKFLAAINAFGYNWHIASTKNEDNTISVGLNLSDNNRVSSCRMSYQLEITSSNKKIFSSRAHEHVFQKRFTHFGHDRRDRVSLMPENLSPMVEIHFYVSPNITGLPAKV